MYQYISLPLKIYLFCYTVLSIISLILIGSNWRKYNLFTNEYWHCIFTPTKFTIYVVGSALLIIPVPYLELHSWDYAIAIFQPTLAYISAPWSLGVFYKTIKKRVTLCELYVACCMMLFTSSWSVEIYLLIRDGYFMPDWLPNIPISVCCYIIVGLLWNIEWKQGYGEFKFIDTNI